MINNKMRKLTLIVIFLFNSLIAISQVIPSENRIDWTPGIPGGIPDVSSWLTKNVVTHFGADNSGANNSLNAIQAGIDNLPSASKHIIYFPAGTYKLEGNLRLRENIVLRGEGINTKLEFYNPTTPLCISVSTYEYGEWQILNASSGYSKGTITLTVPNSSLFTVGEFAELQQTNSAKMNDWKGNSPPSWAPDVLGQLFEVTAVNGNTITLKTPLHLTYDSSLTPKIRPTNLITNVGIENLYITLKTDTDVSLIGFNNAAYCWVKNIVSYKTRKVHVDFSRSLACEVRGSKFSHSYNYDGGGHGYGVTVGLHTANVLIENNAFDHLRHSMLYSLGASGNVYAYNYSQRIHGEYVASNYVHYPADISAHGLYANMNLFESNSVQNIGMSDAWGAMGPGNTYLRNRVESNQTTKGFSYYDVNTLTNVIGNSFITLNDIQGLATNNIEHGNVIDGVTVWDPNINDNNIPPSYYLSNKPDFFGSKGWPLYGPNIGFDAKLPAQDSFTPFYEESNKDELLRVRGPRVIALGETIDVVVDYFAKQDRKLHIALSDQTGVIRAGCFGDEAIEVKVGYGTVTCQITIPNNLLSAKVYSAYLTESNGPSPFWGSGNHIWKINQYNVLLDGRLGDDTFFNIHPNPVKDILNIKTNNLELKNYNIYNMLGQQIVSGILENKTINVSELINGMYFIRFENNKTYKFIKE